MAITSSHQLQEMHKKCKIEFEKFPKKIIVCCGTGCIANGAHKIIEAFQKTLAERHIKDFTIEAVKETGCHGFCEQGPLVVIEPHGTFYTHVKPKDVEAIVDKSIASGEVIEPLLYTNPVTGDKVERYQDVSFFTHQHRIALRNLGKIAAHDIKEYIAVGGYQAQLAGFAKAYTWCPYMQIKPVIGADLNVYACQDKAYNLAEGLVFSIRERRFREAWFANKVQFFQINPSQVCNHHCVVNDGNKMIHEYLAADPEHLAFV